MKTLFTLCLMLLSVLTASAFPEELYLIGSFNNWTTPDQDEAPYILAPTDSAGVYTGTFDIPAQSDGLSFKVLPSKTGLREAFCYQYYGDGNEVHLFSDLDSEIKLVKYLDNDSVPIANWIGGRIKFTCVLQKESKSMIVMTITTPDQPTAPAHPDNVWLIGEFNNWDIPSDTSDNGAIKLNKSNLLDRHINVFYCYPNLLYQSNDAAIPSGKARFVLYYVDPVDNKAKFVGGSKDRQAVGMYRQSTKDKYSTLKCDILSDYIYDNINDARDNAFHIVNYTGPALTFNFKWHLNNYTPVCMEIYWYNAPMNDLLQRVFLYVENLDTNEEYIILGDTHEIRVPVRNKVKIWLTDSEKLPIKKKWGAYSDTVITLNHGSSSFNYLIQDGKPIIFNPGDSVIKLTVKVDFVYHQMRVTSVPAEYYYAKRLYVTGYMSNYAEPIEENAALFQTLPRVSDGVFEGLVYFPAQKDQKPLFGLHYRLDGWQHSGTIGPDYKGFGPVDIKFTDSKFNFPIRLYFQEFWELPNWESRGNVRMRVDVNTWEMTLTNLSTNSVAEIESEEMNAPVVYYNLQGQRVLNPSNGVFIRVQSAKSEKVILK